MRKLTGFMILSAAMLILAGCGNVPQDTTREIFAMAQSDYQAVQQNAASKIAFGALGSITPAATNSYETTTECETSGNTRKIGIIETEGSAFQVDVTVHYNDCAFQTSAGKNIVVNGSWNLASQGTSSEFQATWQGEFEISGDETGACAVSVNIGSDGVNYSYTGTFCGHNAEDLAS